MPVILTLNAGSTSLRFAGYVASPQLQRVFSGLIEGIGSSPCFTLSQGGDTKTVALDASDHAAALNQAMEEVGGLVDANDVVGVGHRIVHGGIDFSAPVRLKASSLSALRRLEPLAPLHQPFNLAGVEAAQHAFPKAPQIGCFDTAFHRTQDFSAQAFALPRRYFDQGVRRYGFHGLSYQSILKSLAEHDTELAQQRLVLAHLGGGSSLCAVQGGRSVATTMGFSPLDGLPMGTRCGPIDPGALLYLLEAEQLSTAQLSHLLYHESGLKGLSRLSGDMRMLEASDAPEATQAIDYYVHWLRRQIAAMAATMGGIDALAFSGGIGQNAGRIRARVVEGLGFLGLTMDVAANAENRLEIGGSGPVRVLVVPTDEEGVIAEAVRSMTQDLQVRS